MKNKMAGYAGSSKSVAFSWVAILLGFFALCGPAFAAQTAHGPDYQKKLETLSTVLGRAHAIQILCKGRSDQYWRNYMQSLMEVEAPDNSPIRTQLIDNFNAGYSEYEARFGGCTAEASQTFESIAREGRTLSEQLNSMVVSSD